MILYLNISLNINNNLIRGGTVLNNNLIEIFLNDENDTTFFSLFEYIRLRNIPDDNFQYLYSNTKTLYYKAMFCTLKFRFLEALYILEDCFINDPNSINDVSILCYLQTLYNTGSSTNLDLETLALLTFKDATYELRGNLYISAIQLQKDKCIESINALLAKSKSDYDIVLVSSIIKNFDIKLNKIKCNPNILDKIATYNCKPNLIDTLKSDLKGV